jgi:hypothetical protein
VEINGSKRVLRTVLIQASDLKAVKINLLRCWAETLPMAQLFCDGEYQMNPGLNSLILEEDPVAYSLWSNVPYEKCYR